MKRNVYAMYDSKALSYAAPFLGETDAVVARAAEEALRDGAMQAARYPEDFALWHVGTFDLATGELTAVVPPRLVFNVVSLVRKNSNA